MKYPDELVREALPPSISVEICGPNYPFALLNEQDKLSPLALSAEHFFGHVMWVVHGSPMAVALAPRPTGKNEPKI